MKKKYSILCLILFSLFNVNLSKAQVVGDITIGPEWDGTCRTNFDMVCESSTYVDDEGNTIEWELAGERNYTTPQ